MSNSSSPPTPALEPDFYSILGVNRAVSFHTCPNVSCQATEEEIKNAYRRVCIIYHPDKHMEQSSKAAANTIFSKIHFAYTILSDKKLRNIYDEYGVRGVEAAMQIGAYLDRDLHRLKEELAKRRTSWRNRTIVSSGIDASMLSEDWTPIAAQMNWYDYVPTMNSFSINHRIDGNPSESTVATVVYSVAAKNGNGTGIVSGIIAKQISERLRGRLDLALANQKRLGIGLTVALTSKMSMDLLLMTRFYGGSIDSSYQLSFSRVMFDNYVFNTTIFDRGMLLGVSRTGETNPGSCSVQYSGDGFLAFDTKTSLSLDENNVVKFKLSSSAPIQLSLGLVRKFKGQKLSYFIEAGMVFGVGLRFGYSIGDLHLSLPIYISRELTSQSILLGVGVPSLIALAIQNFVVEPYRKYQIRKYWDQFRDQQRHVIEQRKEEAQLAIDLMTSFYERKVATEKNVDGLIIVKATYEKTSPMGSPIERERLRQDDYWDVTIPLQTLVFDSQLHIDSTTKADLLGFYDIVIGSPKILRVEYLFRSTRHIVVVKDDQPLCCPLRQHIIIDP